VIRYFLRGFQAHFQAGRSLFAMSLLGVAVGVASVVSIQIININALGAFEGSLRAVSGEADLSVVGRTPVVAEEVYPQVLAARGVKAAWPLYRVEVALANRRGFFLEIVGFDLFAPLDLPWEDMPRSAEGGGPLIDLTSALGDAGWVAVSPALAEEMEWEKGDRIEVTIGSRRAELFVGALVDFQKATPLASRRLAVMDIAQAQGLLGRSGEIHQIDVQIHQGVNRSEFASELQARLGAAVQVLTPEQREARAADLLSSFRLNLTALSLISLFVGGFLIYSSTQAALVRRRAEFGLLRSLGATRSQLLGLILGESCVLGLLGVAVGIPLGYVAAASSVDRVSSMLSNVYVLREIETIQIPPWLYPLALAMGVAGALAGSLLPALDVSRRDTRSLLASFTLHERMGAAALPLFVGGWIVMAAGGSLYLYIGESWPPGGFILAIVLILAVPLMTPYVVQQGVKPVRVRGFGFAFGFKGLGLQLQTTPFAIAALAVAVAMMVGITVMVGSFRRTLEVWVNQTLRADIYITSPSWRRGATEATLEPALVSSIASHPGVRGSDQLRQFFVLAGDRRISLAGVRTDLPVREGRFIFLQGNPQDAFRRLSDNGAILVGEPLARKTDLRVGENLVIEGPSGPISFPVAGIYYDYSSDSGAAVVSLRTMEEHFGPHPINNIALYLEPGRDADQVINELRSRFAGVPLSMRSNRRLREEVLRIFDQTFAVTRLLQGMSLLIAVCGITLTLLVLARERVSELALYRALGADRHQIFLTYLGKGLGIALFGVTLGGAAGVLLAMILIFVINRAFFGWTLAVYWPWESLAGGTAAILLASVVGSLYPALRASRTPATELRRDDV
jgi:putative ABC transport system permease protein